MYPFSSNPPVGQRSKLYSSTLGDIRRGEKVDTLRLILEVEVGQLSSPPGGGPTQVFDLAFATTRDLTPTVCPAEDKLLYLISCRFAGVII